MGQETTHRPRVPDPSRYPSNGTGRCGAGRVARVGRVGPHGPPEAGSGMPEWGGAVQGSRASARQNLARDFFDFARFRDPLKGSQAG